MLAVVVAGWHVYPVRPDSHGADAPSTGRESLFRTLPSPTLGTGFDIHFRVVKDGTLEPVLESGCYRFVASL
jgi:hypothetical protein